MKKYDFKRILLFSILLLVFLSATIVFILCEFEENEPAFLFPAIIGAIGVIVTGYLVLVGVLFGYKSYNYCGDVLYVQRKGKTVFKIPNSEIKKLTLIYDVDTDNLYLVRFEYNGHKHCIEVNSNNKDDTLKFVEKIEHFKKKNYCLYLIYLLDIFLIN